MQTDNKHGMPIGTRIVPGGGVEFRVWAPGKRSVALLLQGRAPQPMQAAEGGYWTTHSAEARPGDRYRFVLDGEEQGLPDPASRFQPEGPHGPSLIVDPAAYQWGSSEASWHGLELKGQVLYEMHVGTFTQEGTYAAAERELHRLRETGITVLEVMPLADWSGRWGWGYDGVNLYAPFHGYGTPDELRHFIESAHAAGLGVILDVVYNHLGPDGNYLPRFSDSYFGGEATEWGEAINFDGPHCEQTRVFFRENAAYWIREFHFDGLRLDATQSIHDECRTGTHILREIGEAARAAAGGRAIIIVAENEPQDTRLVHPLEQDGFGLDGMWNDDLHHSMMVRLTLRREAYYSDHLGLTQEFVSAARHGFLYQGQHYAWQRAGRGSSARGVRPEQFITFIENHDQVANTDKGHRVRARSHPAVYRAMTAFWLLAPGTPMFFQGQEYGASSRFLYFCDHNAELGGMVHKGRNDFLKQFPSLATESAQQRLPDPNGEETFQASKLVESEQEAQPQVLALHKDLLRLRREDATIRQQGAGGLDGAVLSPECFVLRYGAAQEADERLLVVNLGVDLELTHSPEPLLAAPAGTRWQVLWSSEHPAYGGTGDLNPATGKGWLIPGASATLLGAS